MKMIDWLVYAACSAIITSCILAALSISAAETRKFSFEAFYEGEARTFRFDTIAQCEEGERTMHAADAHITRRCQAE